MATASNKPKGLTIARDGNKLTISWTIPSSGYGQGQQLQYRYKTSSGWTDYLSISGVGKTTTKKTITIPVNNYYPTTDVHLGIVRFRVRGKRENTKKTTYGWSEWAEKDFDLTVPNKPEVSEELDSQQSNVCTFTWNTEVSTAAKKWFRDAKYQSMLVKDCAETDGSKLAWNSSETGWIETAGANASGSRAITEDTTRLASGSWTRWFRAMARGPQGNSAWAYTKHVYAKSNQATVKEIKASDDSSGGIVTTITWEASQPATNPIDTTSVEYKIAVPAADLACPGTGSWVETDVSKDTKGTDAARILIDESLGDDECLYIRVNTTHDGVSTNGVPQLAKIGCLADPSGLSVSVNPATFRAVITAANNSAVPDSKLAVLMRQSKTPDKDLIVGVMPHASGSSSITVQCPDWTDDPDIAFGVYAFVGSFAAETRDDGADSYAVAAKMRSQNTIWDGGNVPVAPDSVAVAETATGGTVRVTWNWSWKDADTAELSWADHEDAWESTDAPDVYEVSNLYASAWNISGLETGKIWYIRVRLRSGETYGPYSNIEQIDLCAPPTKPTLTMSDAIITKDGKFTAYWDFLSGDVTDQAYAEIRTAVYSGGKYVRGDAIAHTLTEQSADIEVPESWTAGMTYLLQLQVSSGSGKASEWSDPVAITVAEPVAATITNTTLETVTISADDEEELTRSVLALTELPMSVTATGAGENGTTIILIERSEDYQMERPDGEEFNGYEGETIARIDQTGETAVTVTKEILIGKLDDRAHYRLWAVVIDAIGQTDAAYLDFEVHWSHQAVMPKADSLLHNSVIEITPEAPSGTLEGDTCDIYRLSADKPVLIVEGAQFGQTYVDPYPAIGDTGGHRVVFKTSNGDYITEDDQIAWIDLMDEFDSDSAIIDFAGEQLKLDYDISLSNNWAKDFVQTRYLGGAIQGDWAPGVERNTSISGVLVTTGNAEEIASLRRLAEYTGVCHVRTQDGSSFDADIQVSESRTYQTSGKKAEFSLQITRIDPAGLDGIPLSVWEEYR